MPAPIGHKPRTKQYLLRMSEEENTFVRERAREWEVSINLAICMIINEAQARHRYDELMAAKKAAEAAPPAPPAKKPAKKAPKKAAPNRLAGWTAAADMSDDIPGQTAITDPDQ